MEGMGISTMEGIGCFPVRSQGVHDAQRIPQKGLREDPGLPLSLEGGAEMEDLESFSCWLKNPTPQPKGFGLWGLPFLCCFRQGARDDDPKMGNDNRCN